MLRLPPSLLPLLLAACSGGGAVAAGTSPEGLVRRGPSPHDDTDCAASADCSTLSSGYFSDAVATAALLQTASQRRPGTSSVVASAYSAEEGGKADAVALHSSAEAGEGSLVARINAATTAASRLELAKPLVWVHIPKAGTSMVNLLYNHPGICPYVPDGVKLPEDTTMPAMELFEEYPPYKYCEGSFPDNRPLRQQARHLSFAPVFNNFAGHVIGFFRQPEQRLMSDYFDVNWRGQHAWRWNATPPRDARDFAVESQGCATKMLARDFDVGLEVCLGPGSPPPTEAETQLAVQRVRTGFAFVGITDRWDLSVCLFHAKMGGFCKPAEFHGVRLGARRNSTEDGYDTSELQGFKDASDGRLYDEATRVFEADSARYHVTEEHCQQWCWPKIAD